MASCPGSSACVFYTTIEPSIIKRVRYATAYGYCRGGQHESCALYAKIQRGLEVPPGLLPDGSIGTYQSEDLFVVHRFLVIEDSPVFAALASSTVASTFSGAQVVRKTTYEEAADELADGMFSAVICGYGVGGGRTAHDVRQLTAAPMVVLTGIPGAVDAPVGAQVVRKGAGPEALAAALRACIV